MRVRLKGINYRRKVLADGTVKTYYWGHGRAARRCVASREPPSSLPATMRLPLAK